MNETSHAMASTLVHYADIYDPEDKKHSEPRWSSVDKIWKYYEGYGQRECSEKRDFLESINRDHELWSGETPERKRAPRIFTFEEHIDRMLSWSDVGLQVDFLTETWDGMDRGLPQGSNPTFILDGRDRKDRLSWNFSKMLCDYYEKAVGKEKDIFFKGGVGSVWSKNMKLMEEFGPLFDNISMSLGDENFKISLSDQSVKGYPQHSFTDLKEKYEKFMKEKKTKEFKFNPMAKAFSMPQKPSGVPPPRRPSASSRESASLLVWDMKQESDKKIDNLEKKLDLLISMNGPVIEAEQI